jgi:hypothetical protein
MDKHKEFCLSHWREQMRSCESSLVQGRRVSLLFLKLPIPQNPGETRQPKTRVVKPYKLLGAHSIRWDDLLQC